MTSVLTPRLRRVLIWALVPVLLLGALTGLVLWASYSSSGLQTLLRSVNVVPGLALETDQLQGNLRDGFSIKTLRMRAGSTQIALRELVVGPIDLHRAAQRSAERRTALRFASVQAQELTLTSMPSTQPGTAPKRLSLPLTLQFQHVDIARIALITQSNPPITPAPAPEPGLVINALQTRFTWGRNLDITSLNAEIAGNTLSAAGQIGGKRPFALEMGGTFVSRLKLPSQESAQPPSPVQLTWRAAESLERMALYAGASGGNLHQVRGSVRAQLLPFTPQPVQALSIELENINPADWRQGAPHANLEVEVDLKTQNAEQLRLSGPLRLRNTMPGAINRSRLPLRALNATLTLDPRTLDLASLQAALGKSTGSHSPRSNTVTGSLHLALTAQPDWQAELELNAVDLSSLHDGMQPLVIQGPISASSTAGQSNAARVKADLRSATPARTAAQLSLNFVVDATRLALDEARLRLGAGSAQAQGEWTLSGNQAFALNGTLDDLDPSLLLRALQGQAPTRLNGTLKVQGEVQPALQAQARLDLTGSKALGRDVQGQVALDLHADQRMSVDAALGLRQAQLTVRGTLAGKQAPADAQAIVIALQVPDLSELGLSAGKAATPLRGSLKADARLSGDWHAPAIEASATLDALQWDQQQLQHAEARLNYSGGRQGTLALQVNAQEHEHPQGTAFSVAQAALNLQGTLPALALQITGSTRSGTTLELRASAQQQARAQGWQGSLDAFNISSPLSVQLLKPAPLQWAPQRFAVGPMALSVQEGQFSEVRLETRGNQWSTEGQFDALRIAASASGIEPRLTLRGRWSLQAAEVLNGSVHVERVSGDVYGGPATQRVRMGLTELLFDATVRTNRLALRGSMRGSEVGTLNAALQAELEPDADSSVSWHLAQQRPWSGELNANTPTLAWINPFLTALRDNVRIGGKADIALRLSGTPRQPEARGHVNADALRMAWIEQGVRLDNGSLRARLVPATQGSTDFLVDRLSFSGAPRVRPQDRRIQAVLAEIGEAGTFSASGSVRLPALQGVVQVSAEKFPVLQRPDRWAVATGGANIVFSPQHVQLNGAVRTDAGFIDITQRPVPTLSNDVILNQPHPNRAPTTPEARVPLDFSLGVDLGPAFIVRGAGLDTRVEGALQLKHEGRNTIRATGTLEARDGVYEGYGQKLSIEHGRLNFQGPVENPGLDILALRKGLPVEVGVTITRSASQPLVKLYSDPAMPDIETLSWLVLGRPADDTRNDSTALARAALGLLGGSGEGIPTQLARRLGIDEFSIRGADAGGGTSLLPRQSVAGRLRGDSGTVSSEVVAIGKRLSDNFTVTYETATTGSSSAVQLSYQLTRRLSLIGRAGTESTLDLVYGFVFD